MFLIPVFAIVLFVVLAVFAASVLHAIGKGSFKAGFSLLFLQCMGLLGAPLGLLAAWLSHAYVLVPNGSQVELWVALVTGTLLGGIAGVLAALGSMRVFGWVGRRVRRPGPDAPTPHVPAPDVPGPGASALNGPRAITEPPATR